MSSFPQPDDALRRRVFPPALSPEHSQKTKDLIARVEAFFDKYVYPTEEEYHAWDEDPANLWKRWPGIDKIKDHAKAEGLWNLFLPEEYGEYSAGLTNMEYAPLAEIMGRDLNSSRVLSVLS